MRVLRCIFVVSFLLGSCLAGWAELANGIQAVVHDSVITYQQVQVLNLQTANELRRQYATRPDLFVQKASEVQSNNVEKLVVDQLILHEFKTAGYNLPDSVLDDIVRERIKAEFGDRAKMTKTLEAQGINFEKYRQQIKDQFIIRAMREKNIGSEIIISPHKIEVYYDAHKEEFKIEDQVKLRMIVLNKTGEMDARKLADEILLKLKEGTPFTEMATIYSQGSQRREGGDWGWVERSVLRKELAEVAFTLKPGAQSDVIDTPDACYIMLVEDTKQSHYKPLNEVRDQIER